MSNYFAPDGYRYGVRFNDGSVRNVWNGRTQQQHAEDEAALLSLLYAPDDIVPVRHAPDGQWRTYTIPGRPEALPGIQGSDGLSAIRDADRPAGGVS